MLGGEQVTGLQVAVLLVARQWEHTRGPPAGAGAGRAQGHTGSRMDTCSRHLTPGAQDSAVLRDAPSTRPHPGWRLTFVGARQSGPQHQEDRSHGGQWGLRGDAEEEPSFPRTPWHVRLRTLCWDLHLPSWPPRSFVPDPHPVSNCPRPELGGGGQSTLAEGLPGFLKSAALGGEAGVGGGGGGGVASGPKEVGGAGPWAPHYQASHQLGCTPSACDRSRSRTLAPHGGA